MFTPHLRANETTLRPSPPEGNLSAPRCASIAPRLAAIPVFILCLFLPCACFAGDNTPPPGYDKFLECVFFSLGGIYLVVCLWQKIFPKRNPPIESEFVIKAELEKFCTMRHSPVGTQLDRIELRLGQIETDNEARSRRLHERIENLVPVVYKIAGHLQIAAPGD